MLKRFFRSRDESPPLAPAAVPAGQRIYAIGDIHGRADLLDTLLDMIDDDVVRHAPADVAIIFLGDLVDRGPDSAAVVDRVMRLVRERSGVRCLLGNHEEIFLKALSGEHQAVRAFCRIGGRETILSYGVTPQAYEAMDYQEVAEALQRCVGADHQAFLASLEDVITIGDYAFVHAGVRPEVPLDQQRTSDLRWIREPFLRWDKMFERTIVHGHTICEDVEYRANRIGIDTGAYASGRLTALVLEGTARRILQT